MKPNHLLKRERELRGWSQARVAEEIGTTALNIGRWERGGSMPYPHFREKLCALFGKDAAALGLLESEEDQVVLFPSSSPVVPPGPLLGSAVLDPAIPLPPPGNMRLVGRDDMLARLKNLLCGDAKPVSVALNGLPGVGKTALATDLVYDPDVRLHFQDGILWAGLGLKPDVTELLSRWGILLGVSMDKVGKESDNEAWARAIRSAIGWRQMLLVIDDAWEMEEALAFQVGGPCCAYLVTTRHPHLAVQLAIDGALTVPELLEQDGLLLLARYAGEFVEQAPETALALVRSVGSLPLALTLMGRYLRIQVYSGQPRRLNAAVEHLRDARTRLQLSEARTLTERHPALGSMSLSLQSVIAVSEQLLDASVRSALRALSVFPAKPNSFAEEAALEVCQTSLEVLDQLCDAGLLESNGPSRYMLHQTIADYARATNLDQAVSERLVSYYVRFLKEHASEHELLGPEINNILTAFECAYKMHRREELVSGVCACAEFLLARGLYSLAEKHLRRAYEETEVLLDARGSVNTLLHLGLVELAKGNVSQAADSLTEGLRLAREAGYEEQIGDLLRNLGKVETARGNYASAEVYFREGLALARKFGQREQQCRLLTGLGTMAGRWGDYSQGEACFQEGLSLARELGNQERMAALFLNLGWMENEQGNYSQAEMYYLECLSLARQYDYDELCGAVQLNLGWLAGQRGNSAEGQAYLNEALALLRKVGNRLWVNQALTILGDFALVQGDEKRAECYLEESLALARRFEHHDMLGQISVSLGDLETRRGNYELAAYYLHEALSIGRNLAYVAQICSALVALGELHLRLRQWENAIRDFTELRETAPVEHREFHSLALFGLARVALARGDSVMAYQQGEASLEIFLALEHFRASEVADWLREIGAASEA